MTPAPRAFVRTPGLALVACELSFVDRRPIDLALAAAQHAAYCDALRAAGADVVFLPPAPDLPDAVFVEDTAVVLGDVVVVTRPGSDVRRREIESAAPAFAAVRRVAFIREPATIDGGDVLRIGRDLYVGVTARTNRDGFDQLHAIASRLGYRAFAVPVRGCLHLKTAVTALDHNTVVLDPAHVDPAAFAAYDIVESEAAEPEGANVLRVNGRLFLAASAPRTREAIARRGYDVVPLDISEFEKAEAGLTCLSVLV